MSGRTLAIGDIHGCDTALRSLISHVEIQPDDTLVILGDVVDRGPGSRDVIEQLLALKNQCQFIFIQGNHEEMMLDALSGGEWVDDWYRYGGDTTLISYGGDKTGIPQAHLDFLRSGLDYWTNEIGVFVHANLEPGVPLEEQIPEWLRWTHLTGFEKQHPSGKRVICGHTPQKSGLPRVQPGWVCIDTFANSGGWLTCLDLSTNHIWQTNELGKFRTGNLESAR